MLGTAITTFVACLVLFIVVAVFVQIEHKRGKRLLLKGVRAWLDIKMALWARTSGDIWHHFTQYVVRLGWYYSIHSLLRTILAMLVSIYTYFEGVFERNRARTKQLRMERRKRTEQTHFSKIADHKAQTALTSQEQEVLRTKKLEENH